MIYYLQIKVVVKERKKGMKVDVSKLDELILLISNTVDEKQKRIFLGKATEVYGRGGATHIKKLTGTAFSTLHSGKIEVNSSNENMSDGRIRREGAGRKSFVEHHPEVINAIEKIIDGQTYGDPSKVIHWVPQSMSLRKIKAILLEEYGINISYVKISQLLTDMGYSKQVNQKMLQVGEPSPNRDEQFEVINDLAKQYLETGDPVISVDTKKKENIGNFKNNGSEYRKSKNPRRVWDHDFPIAELGKVNPYGVYVVNNNTGFINLGTDHDTSKFAVTSIAAWWDTCGKNSFPESKRIYITCDGGGSNSSRSRAWKCELQEFANYTGLEVMVSHYPPGSSKWNKIEHRMFCYISKNWQGQPLIDIQTVVSLISSTTTKNGLKIDCTVDNNLYEIGQKISDDKFAHVNLFPFERLGSWNYTIKPNCNI